MDQFLIVLRLNGVYLHQPLNITIQGVEFFLYPETHACQINQLKDVKEWKRNGKNIWDYNYKNYQNNGLSEGIQIDTKFNIFLVFNFSLENSDFANLHSQLQKKIRPLIVTMEFIFYNFFQYDTILLFKYSGGITTFNRLIELQPQMQHYSTNWKGSPMLECRAFEEYFSKIVENFEKKSDYFSFIELFVKGTLEKDGLEKTNILWRSLEQIARHYCNKNGIKKSTKVANVSKMINKLGLPLEYDLINKTYSMYNCIKHEEANKDEVERKFGINSNVDFKNKWYYYRETEDLSVYISKIIKKLFDIELFSQKISEIKGFVRFEEVKPFEDYFNPHPRYDNLLGFIERRTNWKNCLMLRTIPGEFKTEKLCYLSNLLLGWMRHSHAIPPLFEGNLSHLHTQDISKEGQLHFNYKLDPTNVHQGNFISSIIFGNYVLRFQLIANQFLITPTYSEMQFNYYNLDLRKVSS